MNVIIMGKIMELGVLLNRFRGLEVFVELHGNTGCICVIVKDDGKQVYENRVFTTNECGLLEIKGDLVEMKQVARKEGRKQE